MHLLTANIAQAQNNNLNNSSVRILFAVLTMIHDCSAHQTVWKNVIKMMISLHFKTINTNIFRKFNSNSTKVSFKFTRIKENYLRLSSSNFGITMSRKRTLTMFLSMDDSHHWLNSCKNIFNKALNKLLLKSFNIR